MWYRRTVTVPTEWSDRRVVLHFGAVDHDATVWVNDVEVVRHRGGFSSFETDITDCDRRSGLTPPSWSGRATRHRGPQARGKQAREYANHDCVYTRTTGIWQTVWLEAVPEVHLQRGAVTPNVGASSFTVELPVSHNRPGWTATATAVRRRRVTSRRPAARVDLDRAPTVTPGDPGRPRTAVVADRPAPLRPDPGAARRHRAPLVDRVQSYTGLRSVSIDGQAIKINGERVFQRLVLDQGYWPESLMTAPDDDALRRDIELSLAAGFNGARLHQKVFEERFFYHADRLGYLVWGEFGDWGASLDGHGHRQPAADGQLRRPSGWRCCGGIATTPASSAGAR